MSGITRSIAGLDRRLAQAGERAPGVLGTPSAVTPNNTRMYWARLVPSRNVLCRSIGFNVQTAALQNDAVVCTIEDSAGARLVSSGSVTGKLNATGFKSVAVTATPLIAGQVYYLGLYHPTTGGTACKFFMTVNAGSDYFGTTIGTREQAFQDSGSLPASGASMGGPITNVPILTANDI